MTRLLRLLVQHRYEHRKIKHVIALLELEEARCRLDPNGKPMGNYIRALRRYLEEA